MTVSHNDDEPGRPQKETVAQDVIASWLRSVIKQPTKSAEDGTDKSSVLELWKTHGLTKVLSNRSALGKRNHAVESASRSPAFHGPLELPGRLRGKFGGMRGPKESTSYRDGVVPDRSVRAAGLLGGLA